MGKSPITTIWQQKPDGLSQIAKFEGLPFGNLHFGEVVNVPGMGRAKCDGKTTAGSGKNETVSELRLTLQ